MPSPVATRESEKHWEAKVMAGPQIPLPRLLQLTVVHLNRRVQLPGWCHLCHVSTGMGLGCRPGARQELLQVPQGDEKSQTPRRV